MKIKFALILLFLPALSFAKISRKPNQVIEPASGPEIIVHTYNEEDQKEFSKYKPTNTEDQKPQGQLNSLPHPKEMEQIFKVAGVFDRTSKWDQLEKDMFALKIKKYSLSQLITMFPNFSEKELKLLKELFK